MHMNATWGNPNHPEPSLINVWQKLTTEEQLNEYKVNSITYMDSFVSREHIKKVKNILAQWENFWDQKLENVRQYNIQYAELITCITL